MNGYKYYINLKLHKLYYDSLVGNKISFLRTPFPVNSLFFDINYINFDRI